MTDPHTDPAPPPDGGCDRLIDCLTEEQTALEHLLFKLREQHMVLSAGEHRWLSRCTAEVEAAVADLTTVGSRREELSGAVHRAHGLPTGSSLGALAEAVTDELTCQRLLQRQRSLRDILDQVRRASRQNRELLAHGLAATNDALAMLGVVPTYDSAGGTVRAGGLSTLSFDARV